MNERNLAPDVPHADLDHARIADPRSAHSGLDDSMALLLSNVRATHEILSAMHVFPETATSSVDAGALPIGTSFPLNAKLFNVPIRFGYIENNSSNPVRAYRGTTGAGTVIVTVPAGTWACFVVGQDVFDMTVQVAAQPTSGVVLLCVSDRVYSPGRGAINLAIVNAAPIAPTTLAGTGGVAQSTDTGSKNVAIAAAAAAAAFKTGPGRIASILVTVAGTVAMTITDGAGGIILAIVKATAVAGDRYQVDMPFTTSGYVNSGAGSPGVTINYD